MREYIKLELMFMTLKAKYLRLKTRKN